MEATLPSAGIRWAPFTRTKRSPLADSNRSPGAKSNSPNTASSASSSDRSDKPLVSAPRYGFNPDFQLGFNAGSSSRSRSDDPSPTKPSPTYSASLHVPAGAAPVEDEVTDEKSDKVLVATSSAATSGDSDDEKKAAQLLVEPENPDEVSIDMGSITHPSLTESTALVIPCHNADVEVLKAVLFAALVHFEPWQIFVVEHTS